MEQLVMKATTPYAGRMGVLPEGYRFVPFGGSAEDVADWKRIIMEPPSPPDGADSCYHLMIEIYPDVIPEKDIHFIENAAGERVGTITTITHKDGSGYVHMVKAMQTERGKGLGHRMVEYALEVFRIRSVPYVILTTDDFRLPAIKTYLDAGFLPVVHGEDDSEINRRWDVVLEKLQYPAVKRIQEG